MTTVDTPLAALIAVPALLVLVTLALVLVLRSRKGHARRLGSAVARLDDAARLPDRGGLEALLSELELAVDHAVVERNESRSTLHRLGRGLDAVGHGVVLADDRGSVVWRNRTAREFAQGRHADAVLERHVRELLNEALEHGTAEQALDLFGPPRRVVRVRAEALSDGPADAGVVAVVEDVSARHRVEAMRRDFVANISHELKTPIGALGLLAETLAAEDEPDVARRLADRMQRESQRVARIIDDLLDLSRIEAEEAPRRESVGVDRIVAEAVERVASLAESRHITLREPDVDEGLSLVCDRRQVVSAVFNLLENAVKYSSDGDLVEIVTASDGGTVVITVRDQGAGIPAKELDRIFERFYRVDRGRSRERGGTGLGLAIVRHVTANHGGDVRVESREGEGSIFTLRFPAGPVVAEHAAKETTAAVEGGVAPPTGAAPVILTESPTAKAG